ncbi:MAG: hypothetical protein WC341_14595 [Bacteroidales bacterium]|jgi:hypothetical protein
MRAILLFTGLFFSLILSAQSVEQNYQHHDVMLSYGLFPIDQFLSSESDMLNKQYPDKRYIRDHYSGSGIISFTYRHISQNEMVLWGFTAGYNQSSATIYNLGTNAGTLDRQFITVAADIEYRYVNRGIIQLYSGVSAGYQIGSEKLTAPVDSGLSNDTGSINRIAYQANVLGIRIGKSIGGFAEFGFGYKGIINLGLSLQLF